MSMLCSLSHRSTTFLSPSCWFLSCPRGTAQASAPPRSLWVERDRVNCSHRGVSPSCCEPPWSRITHSLSQDAQHQHRRECAEKGGQEKAREGRVGPTLCHACRRESKCVVMTSTSHHQQSLGLGHKDAFGSQHQCRVKLTVGNSSDWASPVLQ